MVFIYLYTSGYCILQPLQKTKFTEPIIMNQLTVTINMVTLWFERNLPVGTEHWINVYKWMSTLIQLTRISCPLGLSMWKSGTLLYIGLNKICYYTGVYSHRSTVWFLLRYPLEYSLFWSGVNVIRIPTLSLNEVRCLRHLTSHRFIFTMINYWLSLC